MKLEWKDVHKCKPPEDTLLMVTGDSGYITHKKFLCLAYYDEEFRPSRDNNIRWLNVCNDELTDNCWRPTHWSYPVALP